MGPIVGLMSRCTKLLEKARRSSSNLRFEEACRLAERFAFSLARTAGSHRIYKKPGVPELINLQNVNGMAKAYQVEQVLGSIAELGLDEE